MPQANSLVEHSNLAALEEILNLVVPARDKPTETQVTQITLI